MSFRRVVTASLLPLLLLSIFTGCTSTRSEAPSPSTQRDFAISQFEIRIGEPHTASEKGLTVGTYNIHWFASAERLKTDIAACAGVDVWCLQEVRCGSVHELRARLASVLPAGRWFVALVRVNRLAEIDSSDDECQAIVSRVPIVRAEVWPLPRAGDKARVALAARIEVDQQPCVIIDTDHEPAWATSGGGSRMQLPSLLERLEECPEKRTIVCGDFNTGASLPRLRSNESENDWVDSKMAEHGFADAVAKGNTFHDGLLWLRLDRIFVRQARVEEGRIVDGQGSDHRPVWCRVTFTGR